MPKHVKINQAVLDYLEEQRIYLRPRFNFGDALGKIANLRCKVEVESYGRIAEGATGWGFDTSVGAFSYIVPGGMLEGTRIGRFSSIGANVRVMGENHPLDRVTTSTWTYGHQLAEVVKRDFGCEIEQNRRLHHSKPTQIGHDVWIGDNVTIKRGVTIGHGAIIGACAVVSKDVAAYSICAGNPAKHIRYRFDERQIQTLLESRWWDLSPSILAEVDLINIEGFIEHIDSQRQKSHTEYEYAKVELSEAIENNGEVLGPR